ncbi:T-lymphoma invasion and metastasis-inducing protein 2 [Fukomys damarensis]|uniref:T-lymphoma invasion and metastasis-inducing protein 2 n=1 Tax=Fukomys damarensis TaxID=885580 RepID=UPI00145514EA|nr:T-lymphoma invasion and metastasis-inducing protein 2 [Fukomys damarensis]
MGNSESQYTLQGSKNHSNTITGAKQKPCSLKIRSIHAKDEKSLHSWTQGSSAAGYKSRSLARSCLSHFKSHQPYASRLSGPTCKVSKGITYAKHRASSSGIDFQGSSVAFSLGNGFHYDDHKPADNHITSSDCNGHLLNCYGRNESAASTPAGEDRRSPRVLIKTLGKLDGCLRVEFHNGASHSKGPAEDPRGPVQLLRYSPTLASETSPVPEARRDSGADSPASQRPSPTDARLRSSKGSSLSSESSWYDSPWGNAGELSEVDGSFLAPSAPDTSLPTNFPPSDAKKPFNQSSSLSSLRDLYKDASLASHSPSGFCLSDDYVGSHTSLSNRVSFASDIDVPSRVEHRDPVQYSSFTLPCRKSKALTEDTAKKDTLKGRMRRISDWTGSLSRKKRKLQEPRSSFDSCSDGLNTDVQVPSPAPALLWPGASAHILSQRSESAHAIGSDPLQQNIYENFMRELEMSRTNTEHIETSTETVESSSESLSSLEQLDLLFEKEQGVVRKAGWLFFKPLVTLQKERKLELVARRKWKQYWVTLKESHSFALPQVHLLDTREVCIWTAALTSGHLTALVADQMKSLRLYLHLTSAQQPQKIQQWEQNLEKFHMDLFRMRCYLASLQGGELPNPKSLLAATSRPSKLALGRLGILSVSSFHALVCSRDDSALRKRTLSLTQRGRSKKGIFSSLKGLDTLARKGKEKRASVTQIFDSSCSHGFSGTHLPQISTNSSEVDELLHLYGSAVDGATRDNTWEIQTYIHFQDNQGVTVTVKPEHRVEDILTLACRMRQLEPSHYGLQLRKSVGESTECCIPAPNEYVQEQVYDEIEIFPLNIYDVQLTKTGNISDFGFAVTAQVDEHQHLSRIFISDVLPDGLAYGGGLRKGNEIVTLNGEAVSDLDLKQMEALFSEKSVGLTLIAWPLDTKATLCASWSDSDLFSRDQKGLLPSPNQSQLLEEFLDNFKKNPANDFSSVPDITTGMKRSQTDGTLDQVTHREKMEQTFRSAEQITTLCRGFNDTQTKSMEGPRESQDPPPRPLARHLSDADRLRKVIQELVDTEKSYVKDLSCLFELYLEPLQNETFLTQDEMESLFGSLPEMLEFQKVFLETLEDGISASSDFDILETPSQFRKLLFSLGGSFLYYADHFKLYSGFCANHIKVQKVLERAKTDKAFKTFLDARNPTKQHSSTLESYLIKPVQRVLKYPLLLKELVSLTDHESEEHYHLTEALKAMEKVASHINEMQKIYEDYGTVFDQLVAEQSGTEKEVTELSMGELLMHSTVSWLNPFLSLGKARKDLELTVFVFKRAVILVYKENCKLKKKLPSNNRPSHSSADLDPFKFRWLIPISALQVRMGNTAGTENNSIWELIHIKSEIEGRPETIFQLCCSDSESKTSIIKVIRSILRENFRRHIKCELPLEKTSKDRLVPLKNRVPVSAKLASSRSLKVLRTSCSSEWPSEASKANSLDSDECSLSSGTQSSGCSAAESRQDCRSVAPGGDTHAGLAEFPDSLIKESDILSDEDEEYQPTLKRSSPTKDIEIQFQRLRISEEPDAQLVEQQPGTGVGEGLKGEQPKLVRAHFCPIKRKANSTKRNRGALLKAQTRHQSLDSHPETVNIDLNFVLEREFSVQSLTSVVNEECFYETESHGKS